MLCYNSKFVTNKIEWNPVRCPNGSKSLWAGTLLKPEFIIHHTLYRAVCHMIQSRMTKIIYIYIYIYIFFFFFFLILLRGLEPLTCEERMVQFFNRSKINSARSKSAILVRKSYIGIAILKKILQM